MTSPEVHDFDWFIDRLEVARWNNNAPGTRDAHAECPVHGGSDSLHVTEKKNGKALINCFSCGVGYAEVVAAIEDAAPVAASTVKLRKAGPRPAYAPTGAEVARQEGVKWVPALRPRGISPSHLHGGLPVLDDVPDGVAVVFTEGHGPAIALNAAGIPAVCSVTGKASAIDDIGASVLYGRRVILSPDKGADDHMDKCGLAIAKSAAEVLIAPPWPEEMLDGQDAADFIAAYGADAMRDHYAAATRWEPPESEDEYFRSEWASDVDLTEPPALLLDRLHPTDYTVLFGDGGVGKGVIAAWWVARLIRDLGYVVLVLDFEENTKFEWAPRVKQFGGDLTRLRIVQTDVAVWDAVDDIKGVIADIEARYPDAPVYMVVDSAAYACMGAEVEKSTTATKYKKTLNRIGLPALSLAHTTKADADPQHPFGSVFWSNGARVTIGVSRKNGDREPGTPRVLRCKKSNQRAPFAAAEVSWDQEIDGSTPSTLVESAVSGATFSRIVNLLIVGPKTVAEIVAGLIDDGGPAVKEATVQASLTRGAKDGAVANDGKKPATWSISGPTVTRRQRVVGGTP